MNVPFIAAADTAVQFAGSHIADDGTLLFGGVSKKMLEGIFFEGAVPKALFTLGNIFNTDTPITHFKKEWWSPEFGHQGVARFDEAHNTVLFPSITKDNALSVLFTLYFLQEACGPSPIPSVYPRIACRDNGIGIDFTTTYESRIAFEHKNILLSGQKAIDTLIEQYQLEPVVSAVTLMPHITNTCVSVATLGESASLRYDRNYGSQYTTGAFNPNPLTALMVYCGAVALTQGLRRPL